MLVLKIVIYKWILAAPKKYFISITDCRMRLCFRLPQETRNV